MSKKSENYASKARELTQNWIIEFTDLPVDGFAYRSLYIKFLEMAIFAVDESTGSILEIRNKYGV